MFILMNITELFTHTMSYYNKDDALSIGVFRNIPPYETLICGRVRQY